MDVKNLAEKQLLEWKEELSKLKEKQFQAKKVLEETSQTILMIEGGIKAVEVLLRKIELESLPKDKEATNLRVKTTRSK